MGQQTQADSGDSIETAVVVSATAYWIRAPLTRPYGLSFGTLRTFDLIIVRLVDANGRVGFGESCPLPPYSPESTEQVWSRVSRFLSHIPGSDPATILDDLIQRGDRGDGFSYVAPATALEALTDPPDSDKTLAVPVVGTVQASEERALPAEVSRLVDLGHRTLKLKVGFDPEDDLRKVALVRRYVPNDVTLRLDANEAWDLDRAARFLAALEPAGIELLEQPLPRDRWEWFESLAEQHQHVPLMLDESVGSEMSVRRAADAGASLVKFKLMKAGSRHLLRQRVRLAKHLGLSVVVGNGVAGVCDNWYEALLASQATDQAGEMNGNLKLADPVFAHRPHLRDGTLCFPVGFTLACDPAELARRSHKVAGRQ